MNVQFLLPRSCRGSRMLRGNMLIDLLIGCIVALLTGAALVSLQQNTYVAQTTVQGQNFANTASRRPLEILSDTLRNAQASGVNGDGPALAAASAADVTCYTPAGTSRIWLDTNAHVLRRTKTAFGFEAAPAEAGAADDATSEALVTNVQSLQMTYYMPAGNAYNTSVESWPTTTDPHAPSEAELPGVGAVNILATISADGETRTLQSFVRLRNSPAMRP